MKRLLATSLCLVLAVGAANAQIVNGNNNGNGNSGTGSGNGNGNGNANGSNNTTTASASAGNSSVTLNGRHNTPTVIAPGLAAAGIETCLGSNSVGGAGPGFGVTIAGTITDRGCNLRLYSRTLYSMGHKLAATQILCNDPDVAAALALEGVQCLVGPAAEAQARALASARAEAIPAEAIPAPDADTRSPCQHWVLFKGCLDAPRPAPTQPAISSDLAPRTGLASVTPVANRVARP